MITVVLSGQQRGGEALKVCGPGPVKTGTGTSTLLSSPPADFRGFSYCGGGLVMVMPSSLGAVSRRTREQAGRLW